MEQNSPLSINRIQYWLLFICGILVGCSPKQDFSAWQPPALDTLSAQTTTTTPPSETLSNLRIALLVPLKGPLGKAGRAIRDGFLAAYYQTPAKPSITVLDTSSKDIRQVYREACSQGINFIVGPLTKPEILLLSKSHDIKIPTLALNSVGDNSEKNLFQFGLSSEDEVIQIAQRARQGGHANILIITPNKTWGLRLAALFRTLWEKSNGQVVAQLNYTSLSNLDTEIKALLQIDESQAKEENIQALVGKTRFTPARRQDFDAIFLVASPKEAREILPLLQFYYAGNIPTYALSDIYPGYPLADRDLTDVLFIDIPFVLANENELPPDLKQLHQLMSVQHYQSSIRLFALGVDAYRMVPWLFEHRFPQGKEGATGKLYLLNNQHIYRKMSWSKLKEGVPESLN